MMQLIRLHGHYINDKIQRYMKIIKYAFSSLSSPDIFKLALALLLMLGAAFASNYPALLSGQILDQAVAQKLQPFGTFSNLLILLVLSYFFRELFVVIRKYLVEGIATRIEKRKLFETTELLYNSNLAALYKERVGILNARISRSVIGLVKFIKLSFMNFVPTMATAMVALVLTAKEDFYVTIVIILMFVLALSVTIVQVLTQKGIRLRLLKVKEVFSANLFEVIQSLDYVRVSNGIDIEKQKAHELTEDLRATEFKHHKYMMNFDALKQFIEGLGLVFVVAYGAWQVTNDMMSYGTVLTLTLLYNAAAQPLRELHKILDEGMESLLLVRELQNLEQMPQDLYIGKKEWPENTSSASLFSISNLSLVLNIDGEDKQLVNDISFDICAGERVAFVGGSGSGKSTVMKCILGLFPDTTGSIKFRGVDIKQLDKKRFWHNVGYVSQSPHIVSGTILENVFYGNKIETSDQNLLFVKKLELVNLAARFSNDLEGDNPGTQQILENGRNLSGGEKQRVSIARLFGRTLDAIFLDEATSGLDNESEKLVVGNIATEYRGSAIVSIAHRLDTIADFDKIIVFKEGSIVEVGTYDQLIEARGEFYKISNV